MQETIIRLGRVWFLTTVIFIIAVFFVGEVFFVYKGKDIQKVSIKSGSSGGVLLAGSQLMESDYSQNVEVKTKVVSEDARPLLIKRYLEKYKSPLVPYSDLILRLSDTYGYEYYWIVAIAQQESNLCKKIPQNSYNCWGYGINSAGTLRFDSYELALKSYAEYLKRAYFDKGLNTPELIMKKYCPNSNGSWAFGVRQFINEIEGGV
jgi:hypothetical protein